MLPAEAVFATPAPVLPVAPPLFTLPIPWGPLSLPCYLSQVAPFYYLLLCQKL